MELEILKSIEQIKVGKEFFFMDGTKRHHCVIVGFDPRDRSYVFAYEVNTSFYAKRYPVKMLLGKDENIKWVIEIDADASSQTSLPA